MLPRASDESTRRNRTLRWLVATAGLAALLASCTSHDEPGVAIREIEPAEEEQEEAEPEPEPELGARPGKTELNEPEPEPELDQTEVEGITRAGVHVPADAYEINEELDVEEEQQRSLLDLVVDAYFADVSALNTLEYGVEELQLYFAEDELDLVVTTLDRSVEDRERQVNTGTIVHTAWMSSFDSGGAAAALRIEFGPEAGIIDADSGEYIFRPDDDFRALSFELALVPVEADQVSWRVVSGGRGDLELRCS